MSFCRAHGARLDIIPEYSFVLGTPGATPAKAQCSSWTMTLPLSKKLKKSILSYGEIIIYVYSPVPTEGSEMYKEVLKNGFKFPEHLEDWLSPAWERFDLRKNPLTPWLTAEMVDKIKNFETVLNGYYPTVSDIKLNSFKINVLKKLSSLRYKTGLYQYPYEIKLLQKLWKYRQPEIEGF